MLKFCIVNVLTNATSVAHPPAALECFCNTLSKAGSSSSMQPKSVDEKSMTNKSSDVKVVERNVKNWNFRVLTLRKVGLVDQLFLPSVSPCSNEARLGESKIHYKNIGSAMNKKRR